MTNIIFDRDTLQVVGQGRNALPYELEIKNVDPTGLFKVVNYIESKLKVVDGKQVYLLPQPDKEITTQVADKTEVYLNIAESTTLEPVMMTVVRKVPILDDNGDQKYYYQTYTTIDEAGQEIVETSTEKTFLFTVQEVQEQVKSGDTLAYWQDVTRDVVSYESVAPKEITEDDVDFVEGLELAYEDISLSKVVSFDQDMSEFTYDDVVAHKAKGLPKGTFYSQAVLFEEMEVHDIFDEAKADLGYDFVSIPSSGYVLTKAITLPQSSDLVNVYTETSIDGLTIQIGKSTDDLKDVNKRNEVQFTDGVTSSVYVKISNNTDKRINLYSIGLLV